VYGGFVYEADPDVETLVGSAEVCAQIGSFDKAIEFAELALKQDPGNRYAHIILAYSYGQKERYETSISHYERAIEATSPDDENLGLLRLYRAEMLVRAGREEQAVTVAESVLEEDPEQRQAFYVVAQARRAQKRYDDALEAYRSVEEAAPDDPMPRVHMAEVEEERGNLRAALGHLDRASALTPDDAVITLRKARVLVKSGDREGAIKEIQAATKTKLAFTRRVLRRQDAFASLLGDPRVREILTDSGSEGPDAEKIR
jgi:tetratricopeptide (TPR) repeat protein